MPTHRYIRGIQVLPCLFVCLFLCVFLCKKNNGHNFCMGSDRVFIFHMSKTFPLLPRSGSSVKVKIKHKVTFFLKRVLQGH